MTNFYYLTKFGSSANGFMQGDNNILNFTTNNVVYNILKQHQYDAKNSLGFIFSSSSDIDFDQFYTSYTNIMGSDILSYTNQYSTTLDMALGNLINDGNKSISNLAVDKSEFYFNKTKDGDIYRYTSTDINGLGKATGLVDIDGEGSATNGDFNDLLLGYEKYRDYRIDLIEGMPDVSLNDVISSINLNTLGIDYNTIASGKTPEEIEAIYQNLINHIISEAKAIKPSTISETDKIAMEKDLETKQAELQALDEMLLGVTETNNSYQFTTVQLKIKGIDSDTIGNKYIKDAILKSGLIDNYEITNIEKNPTDEVKCIKGGSQDNNNGYNYDLPADYTFCSSKDTIYFNSAEARDFHDNFIYGKEQPTVNINDYLKYQSMTFYTKGYPGGFIKHNFTLSVDNVKVSNDGKYLFLDSSARDNYNTYIAGNEFNTTGSDIVVVAYSFDGNNTNKITITVPNIDTTNIGIDTGDLYSSINQIEIDEKPLIVQGNTTATAENQETIKNSLILMQTELEAKRTEGAGEWLRSEAYANANTAPITTLEELISTYSFRLAGLSNNEQANVYSIIKTLSNEYQDSELDQISLNIELAQILDDSNLYGWLTADVKKIIIGEVYKKVNINQAVKSFTDGNNWGKISIDPNNIGSGSPYVSILGHNTIDTYSISSVNSHNTAKYNNILKVDTTSLKQQIVSHLPGLGNAEDIAEMMIAGLENNEMISKIDGDIYINVSTNTIPAQWMLNYISEQIDVLDIYGYGNGNLVKGLGNLELTENITKDEAFANTFTLLDQGSFIKTHNIRQEKYDIMYSTATRTFSQQSYLTNTVELQANTYLNRAIIDGNDNVIVPAGILDRTYRIPATIVDNDGNYVSGAILQAGTVLPVGTKKFENDSLIKKLSEQLTSLISAGNDEQDSTAAIYLSESIMGIIENYLAENFNKDNPETIETYFTREFAALFNPNNKEGIIDAVILQNNTPMAIKMDFRNTSNNIINKILSSQIFYEVGDKLENRTRKEMEIFEEATALDIVQNINTQEYIYRLNLLASLEKMAKDYSLNLDFSMVNKTLVNLGPGGNTNPWWQEYFPWFKGFYGNIPDGATPEDMFDENGNLTGLGQVGGMTVDPYILKINGVNYVLGKDDNQDGKINNAQEILGIEDKIEDNFASLKALDINQDGYISNDELKTANIILQAVNTNERLNGSAMSIDFVKGISLDTLKKENGTNNVYGSFSADMKNGSKAQGIQTFEYENYFHNLFGTYTDLSFLNKEKTTESETQQATTEEEQTKTQYMAGVFSKQYNFFSNLNNETSEISVEKLIDDISWKLSLNNLSASQRYDIIDDIDITKSEDVITTEIEDKLEQIKFSA